MTPDEFVLTVVQELIRKSGVREWESEGVPDQIMQTAISMAATVYGLSEDTMPSAQYVNHGTAIVFGSEVGDDVAWSTESIANSAGRQASLHDQGAEGTARPLYWQYRIYTQAQATPTVGNRLETKLKTSDGTHPDNDDGTSDWDVSAEDKLRNLTMLNSPQVDQAAANIEYVTQGLIEIPHRYFGPVLWNRMGSTITADSSETKAVFTPIYMEGQ